MDIVKVPMARMNEDSLWFLTRPSVREHRRIVLVSGDEI